MGNPIRGVEEHQELSAATYRPDVRRFSQRVGEFCATTDGAVAAAVTLPILGLLLVKMPFSGEVLLLVLWVFNKLYVEYDKDKRFNFPFRVPAMAKLLDGSMARKSLGNGITYLGKEISSQLGIWSGDSDLRTHQLVLGTTGSGKTEWLLGLVYNALVQNSGFIYTDGKGDVALWNNVFRLARYIGRECDLVVINFLTSGRDFLDKQKDRTTNTMNPFALGSSGMLIELIIGLMDDSGGGGDMWKGRAIAFVAALTRVLCFLRDRGYLLLNSDVFIQYFELPVLEDLVHDRKITVKGTEIKLDEPLFDEVVKPLATYLMTLPGYLKDKKGSQEQKTLEQHGYITMQLTRVFGDLSYTYGYLFRTALGEVDMYDVVINRRILVVLLPALERAPDSLRMLGKLIVGAIKQMMAGCLGNRLEGSVREIVKARPTNAPVPYYVVLDEYGYYAVLGFAVAPAQARSLGFAQPKSARIATPTTWVPMGDITIGQLVCTPDGGTAPVTEILPYGAAETYQVVLADGRNTRATEDHLWNVWRVDQGRFHVVSTAKLAWWVGTGVRCAIAAPHPDAVPIAGTSGERAARLAALLGLGAVPAARFVYEGTESEAVAVVDLARSLGLTAALEGEGETSRVVLNGHGVGSKVPVLSVTACGWEETQCIRIDHPDQLYITDEYVVTHNCITFAAQDFSSLQKASKEEADATWENTNVRAVGRIAGGKESETFRRIVGVAGEAPVYQGGGKEYGHGVLGDGFKTNRDVRFERAARLEYDDLAQQQDGEFTLLIGKKKSGGAGGVRIIRSRGFYTQVDEAPTDIRINHFLKVEPPRAGKVDEELQIQDQLEKALTKLLVSGKLKEVFPDEATALVQDKKPTLLYQVSQYIAAGQKQHRLSLGDAIRVALVCCDKEIEVEQERKLREVKAAAAPSSQTDEALALATEVLQEDLSIPEIPEAEIPDIVDIDGGAEPADAGMAPVALPDDEQLSLPEIPEIEEAAPKEKKGDAKGGGSGSGGGMELAPVPEVVEAEESVSSMIRTFISSEQGQPEQDEPMTSSEARLQVSLLNLQEVGNDDVPDQLASYLEETIAETDMLIGTTKDSLQIRANASNAVRQMKEDTKYADGVLPEKPTVESFDKVVEGLLVAAERNYDAFMN